MNNNQYVQELYPGISAYIGLCIKDKLADIPRTTIEFIATRYLPTVPDANRVGAIMRSMAADLIDDLSHAMANGFRVGNTNVSIEHDDHEITLTLTVTTP